jgi:hypothetical protein
LEKDVGEWVARGNFGLDFLLQVVGSVLRFPEAVDEGKGVDERSVGAEGLLGGPFELVLLDEMPAVGRGALLEDVSEGRAGVAFGVVTVEVELGRRSSS